MYEIEKNIPTVRAYKYPFRDMEIGDSFLVPCVDDRAAKIDRSKISGAAWYLRPKKFSTRRVEGGIRVWRVK